MHPTEMLADHCNAVHSTRANNKIQLYCNEIWKIVLSQKPHAGIYIGWLFCCAHNAELIRFGTVKCNDDHWNVHSAHPNEINCGESAHSLSFSMRASRRISSFCHYAPS